MAADSTSNTPNVSAGLSSPTPEDAPPNVPVANASPAVPTASMHPNSNQTLLATDHAEILATIAREEVDRVANALSEFEFECKLIGDCIDGVTDSVALGCDRAWQHNSRDIALLETVREERHDDMEAAWVLAREALDIANWTARRVLRYQYAAALYSNAPRPEDMRGPVPMYTPASNGANAVPCASALVLYESTVTSFSQSLQLLADSVFHGCIAIRQASVTQTQATLVAALRSVADAHDVALDVLKELHRHAYRTIRRQFDAAVTGDALRFDDARRRPEPYESHDGRRSVRGGGIYVGGVNLGRGVRTVERGANVDTA